MNEVQWEYLLLHSLPKEWVPMTDEVQPIQTEEEQKEPERRSENIKTNTEETRKTGEEVSGTPNRQESTDSKPDSDGGKEDTHSTGQSTETITGGRVPVGSGGNTPGKPDVIPAGDAGKDSSGNWRTRKTERKSLPFQKRIRERKAASGQKG